MGKKTREAIFFLVQAGIIFVSVFVGGRIEAALGPWVMVVLCPLALAFGYYGTKVAGKFLKIS